MRSSRMRSSRMRSAPMRSASMRAAPHAVNRIRVSVNAFTRRGAAIPWSGWRNNGGQVSLNLSVPLYTGGFISASRRQAYEQYNTQVENYAGVVRTTLQATRAFHIQVTTDVARTRARRLSAIKLRSCRS